MSASVSPHSKQMILSISATVIFACVKYSFDFSLKNKLHRDNNKQEQQQPSK